MKIMVASDSPTSPTGFAGQMKAVVKALADDGHDLFWMGWQTTEKQMYKDENIEIEVLPALNANSTQDEIFGRRMYPKYFEEYNPDVLITLGDAWMVNQIPSYKNRPIWIMYYPVDGHPLNDDIRRTVSSADIAVAMSKYGQQLCKAEGIRTFYIPHQLDFKKLNKYANKKLKESYRKQIFPHLDNVFIFGSIARANPRKHHMRLMRAFEIFVRENNLTPNDVRLYLHCDPYDAMYNTQLNAHNYFFVEFAQTLGINDYIIYPDLEGGYNYRNGYPEDRLHATMSCIDVHVNATGGEGFGVPTIEIMAMGIPNIITDYTTSRELIVHKDPFLDKQLDEFDEVRGVLVSVDLLYMENSAVNKAWVNVKEFAEAMKLYYEDRELVEKHGKNAIQFSKLYDKTNVNNKWVELINNIPEVSIQ
jgi:glycosyltransferase involved in cell wall biosynthesis